MGFTLFCCGLRGCRVRDNYSGNLHRGGSVTGGRLGVHVVVRVTDENLDAENAAIVLFQCANHAVCIGVHNGVKMPLGLRPEGEHMAFAENACIICGILATCQILLIAKSRSCAASVRANVRVAPLSVVVSVSNIVLHKFFNANICRILQIVAVSKCAKIIFRAQTVGLLKDVLLPLFLVVVGIQVAAAAITVSEIMPQRGNFLGLGLVADSAGKGLDALAVAGGRGGNRSSIPCVIAGCGQVFDVFRHTAGLAGAVNAASLTAGSRGGGLVPIVARGLDGLRLGLVADGAGVQLFPCLGAGSSFCFEKKGSHVMSNNDVPIWEKYTLTIEEASKYFRIGENKLRRLAEENPTAGWVILNGNRIQIKRKQFEKIIDSLDTI